MSERYKRVEELIELDPPLGSLESAELHTLVDELQKDEQGLFDLPSPIEAIKFRMEQEGLKQKDLIPYIGSKSKVSEVLSGKRGLSLRMIRNINRFMGIRLDVLIQEEK